MLLHVLAVVCDECGRIPCRAFGRMWQDWAGAFASARVRPVLVGTAVLAESTERARSELGLSDRGFPVADGRRLLTGGTGLLERTVGMTGWLFRSASWSRPWIVRLQGTSLWVDT